MRNHNGVFSLSECLLQAVLCHMPFLLFAATRLPPCLPMKRLYATTHNNLYYITTKNESCVVGVSTHSYIRKIRRIGHSANVGIFIKKGLFAFFVPQSSLNTREFYHVDSSLSRKHMKFLSFLAIHRYFLHF